MNRFPEDFMFQLSNNEVNLLIDSLRCQIVTSNKGGVRYAPFAFTEQGVAMLAGLLNSPKAIEVNINIMRAFVRMRQYLLSHAPKNDLEELRKRIEYLEEDISEDRSNYEKQFDELFSAFAKLSAAVQVKSTPLGRVEVKGFRKENGMADEETQKTKNLRTQEPKNSRTQKLKNSETYIE